MRFSLIDKLEGTKNSFFDVGFLESDPVIEAVVENVTFDFRKSVMDFSNALRKSSWEASSFWGRSN